METLQYWIQGFAVATLPINLLFALIGCVLGTLIGVLAGTRTGRRNRDPHSHNLQSGPHFAPLSCLRPFTTAPCMAEPLPPSW